MTTIAYSHKLKTVAVDSRVTARGKIDSDSYNKVIKNSRGTWVFCGSCCDFEKLSLLKHDDRCEVIPDCCALRINIGAVWLVLVNSEGHCEELKIEYDSAFGSGGDFALAALDFGKTPKQAVKYASKRDSHTGGQIRVIKIKQGGQ